MEGVSSMAEALSKTSLFSSWNRQHQSISVIPKSCNYNKSGYFSCSSKLNPEMSSLSLSTKSNFHGKKVAFEEHKAMPSRGNFQSQASSVINSQQQGYRIGKALKWWGKGNQPNMKEVTSAQDLVDSLSNAGDKLVIVDFFSPGCGGCKALHPKICQLAEMNPDVQFLQVNYEEHKSMCYSLNVHVLPFFRFYRGAHGRLCSFSCTNATIKKFRDALSKHKPDRCSLGPTKGLEEKELVALAANNDLSFTYTPKPVEPVPTPAEEVIVSEEAPSRPNSVPLLHPSTTSTSTSKSAQVITAWR